MQPGTPQGLRRPTATGAVLKPALIIAAVVALLAAVLAASSPRDSHADPALDSFEQTFLQLINQYRAQNGVGPLITDSRLNAAADWMATDMATDNYFPYNHMDNENPPRGPSQRAAAFGFNAPVGENLAAGFTSAEAVLNAWKNSAGHNGNMLNGSYTIIGIGRASSSSSTYGVYWATDFAWYAPPGGDTPAPTPPPTAPPTQPSTAPPTAPPTTPPTPIPTAPPTAAPTKTPDPTPKPTATPTPAPPGSADASWGDTDCDGYIGPVDSIRVLRLDAGLDTATAPGCPALGDPLLVEGFPRVWGDIDCSGEASAVDAMIILRYDAGFGVVLGPGCPPLGEYLG